MKSFVILPEKKRESFARKTAQPADEVSAMNSFTVARRLRRLAIASVFLLLAPRAFAGATILASSNGDLEAHTQIGPLCVQDGQARFSAPIGNPSDPPTNSLHIPQCSTSNPNTGEVDFVGPIDLQGGYTGNAQSMTLTASGSGSEKVDERFFREHFVSARTFGDIQFEVTGEPTEVPISVSMTVDCEVCEARCILRAPDNQVIGEITADKDGQHGSFPTGALSPGFYSVELTHSYNTVLTLGFTTYNFNFSARITVSAGPTNEIEWANPVDGSFQAAENWDPQQVPSGNDDAVFDVAGTYTVSLDGNSSHNALFGSGTGVNVTFELGGNTYTLNQLQTGGLAGEDASFTFSGVFDPASSARDRLASSRPRAAGGLVQVNQTLIVGSGTNQAYVEQARVSSNEVHVEGILTVKDSGSLLETASLEVGISGDGPQLLIDEGQVVSTHATVEGNAFVFVGRNVIPQRPDPSHWEVAEGLDVIDDGSVSIFGGSVNVGGRCVIGDVPGSFSDVSVGGITVGGTFSVSELIVGRNGKGTMKVSDLGLAQIGSLEIGNDPDNSDIIGQGTVRVEGDGTLLVGNDLIVGGSGKGLLTIDGGTLSQDGPGAQMQVNQDGDVFFLAGTGNLSFVDVNPGGTFSVLNSSIVNASGMSIFGGDVGAVAFGLLKISRGLVVAALGTLEVDSTGQVNIGEGSGDNGMVRVGPNGILSGDGTIFATQIVTAGSGSNQFTGGQINPGNSPGTLTLQGNFTQELGSSLVMEIAGFAEGEFDVLHVTGDSVLNGTLEIRLLRNFLPAAGQIFTLLELDGAVTGSFSEITFPDLQPGFQFEAEQTGTTFQLRALNSGVAANFLGNTSTRAKVGTGDNVLIGGFIIGGNDPKRVIVRAIGPSLSAFGLSFLADPTLELHDGARAIIFSNDNWMESPQKQQIIDSGLPPSHDLESAIVATLSPGLYTAIVRSADGSSGIGLVEVFDLSTDASAILINISGRGEVLTGDDILIGGIIVEGTKEIVARGIGPSLEQYGVNNALQNPTLELRDANGSLVRENDDWKQIQQAELEATGLQPPHDLEAAISADLTSGAYTALLRGKNNATGVGLIEFYSVR